MGVEDRDVTEFGGGGVMPNGVYPKGNDALTPGDKLRLMSRTGQTEDSRAPVDPAFWYGATIEDPPKPDPQRLIRERENARQEARRYRETPRNY